MKLRKVIVECKPDELLAKTLGFKRYEIVHQPNKGEVCNFLEKSGIHFAVINEDPNSNQPKYLKQFSLAEEKYGITKLIHKKENKTIFILKPRLEEWILSRCKASVIKPEDYYLPSNNKDLKDVVNYHLNHFEKLLHALSNKKDKGIVFLQKESGAK